MLKHMIVWKKNDRNKDKDDECQNMSQTMQTLQKTRSALNNTFEDSEKSL